MESTATMLIRRDQQEVFDYVSNPINMSHWIEGVSEPRITSYGSITQGTTFESKYTYGGGTYDINYEVTDFDPPYRFGTRSVEGPFPFIGRLVLDKDPKGTLVSNTVEVGADGVFTKVMFTVLAPFMKRSMRKQLVKELEALRSRLEID
jgi:hypothetical protein